MTHAIMPAGARRVIAIATGSLVVAGAFVAVQAEAAGADDTIFVVNPDDFSAVQETPAEAWNGTLADQECPVVTLPSAPWAFDIEDKPYAGTAAVTDRGLELSVEAATPDDLGEKSRVLHYVGMDWYGIPVAPTLSEMMASPLAWTQQEVSETIVGTYGVTMQIQVQTQIGDDCVRAILLNEWLGSPDKTRVDLWGQEWFAVSPVNGHPVNSVNAVPSSQIASEFGDWQVVAFGPNLGRDKLTYAYTVQSIEAFGKTFVFGIPDAPPPPPPVIPPDATPPAPTPGTPAPQIAPSSQPAPGGVIDVSFPSGTFDPFEWVQFTFYSTPTYSTSLRADAFGALSGAVPVPPSVTTGSHTLAAVGTVSGTVAVAAVTITLPATGSEDELVLGLGAAAAMLVLWGMVLATGAALRRRSA